MFGNLNPKKKNTDKATLKGLSMFPSIIPGATLEIKRKEPKQGDIVCFIDEDKQTVAHRLLKIENGPNGKILITRGDNVAHMESNPESSIIGVVEQVKQGLLTYATNGKRGRFFATLATEPRFRYFIARRLIMRTTRTSVYLFRFFKRIRK